MLNLRKRIVNTVYKIQGKEAPIVADLGVKNTMKYDPERKRWIDINDEEGEKVKDELEKKKQSGPPPPSGSMIPSNISTAPIEEVGTLESNISPKPQLAPQIPPPLPSVSSSVAQFGARALYVVEDDDMQPTSTLPPLSSNSFKPVLPGTFQKSAVLPLYPLETVEPSDDIPPSENIQQSVSVNSSETVHPLDKIQPLVTGPLYVENKVNTEKKNDKRSERKNEVSLLEAYNQMIQQQNENSDADYALVETALRNYYENEQNKKIIFDTYGAISNERDFFENQANRAIFNVQ